MPSRSSANLLDLAAIDSTFSSSPRHPARLPYVMVDPCILSTTGVADGGSPPAMPKCRIIVSHHLPIRATTDPAAPSGWSSYDPGALVLQLRSGLLVSAEVLHVGTLCGLSTASTLPTMMSSPPPPRVLLCPRPPPPRPPRPLLPWLM